MMNYMKDFRMIEDSENPEIVISVGGDGHITTSIPSSIATCYQKWHLLEWIQVI